MNLSPFDRTSTNAPHLNEDSRKVQSPVGEDALLRLQVTQPLLEQRRVHRVPALSSRSQQHGTNQRTPSMFTQPADGIGEGTDLKSASGSPGAPTTMTGPAAPGTSMVVLGGAEADEAMRTPRRRVAARATGEGRGRGSSGSGARRQRQRQRALR